MPHTRTSRDFMDKKGASKILPAAFTDHCAMVISVTMEAVNRWKGNKALANESASARGGFAR
jgi:hypothetical protein